MSLALTVFTDGIVYAAWLFLVSLGLTLVFGVLRLLNVSHGGLYSFGAYCAAFAIGACVRAQYGVAIQILSMVLLALVVGAIIAFVIERVVLARLYSQDEVVTLLATYAVFLILEDLTKLIWGRVSLYANQPRDALGQVTVGSLPFALYDLLLVVVSFVLAAVIWFVLARTRSGRMVVAVTTDRDISLAMGINVPRILTATFVIGSMLGALAGALTAPKIAVLPGMGVEVIVLAFAVVVVGGLGSIEGAVVAAILIGMCRALASHLFPEAEVFVVYAVMAAVLTFRPHGLFRQAAVRRI